MIICNIKDREAHTVGQIEIHVPTNGSDPAHQFRCDAVYRIRPGEIPVHERWHRLTEAAR